MATGSSSVCQLQPHGGLGEKWFGGMFGGDGGESGADGGRMDDGNISQQCVCVCVCRKRRRVINML